MKKRTANRGLTVLLIITLLLGILPVSPSAVQAAAGNAELSPIAEDTFDSPGELTSAIYNSGIGITGVDNAHGQWQYYNGYVWYAIETPQPGTMYVFNRNVPIRYVPNADWNGTAAFTYREWISGDPEASGPEYHLNYPAEAFGEFGETVKTAQITVTPVNDAPYLTEVGGSYYFDFDGSNYASIPDLGIYSNSFTLETEVYATSHSTWGRFFDTSYGMDNFVLFFGFQGNGGNVVLSGIPQQGYRVHKYM